LLLAIIYLTCFLVIGSIELNSIAGIYSFTIIIIMSNMNEKSMGLIHGDFDVSFINNILVVKLIGSFNEFGAIELTAAIKTKIKSLHGLTFCMLVNDIDFHGFTPEAYKVVEESNNWLNKQGLIAKAFVVKTCVQEELDSYFVPAKKEQHSKVFCELETAIKWLKAQSSS